jgi:hypothetical protein
MLTGIVEDTWAELECHVRPLRRLVLVRTEKPRTITTGGIILPCSDQGFYDGPMHLRLITAVVLAAGPDADSDLTPGVRIGFQRRFFARWQELEDHTMVGWVDDSQITGIATPDTDLDKYIGQGPGAQYATPRPM